MGVHSRARAPISLVRRVVLAVVVLCGGLVAPLVMSMSAVTTSDSGLPLFQYAKTSSTPLPWSASSLAGAMKTDVMAGAPRSITVDGTVFLTWRSVSGHAMSMRFGDPGGPVTTDLTSLTGGDTVVDDPWYFVDGYDNQHTIGTNADGHLVMTSRFATPPYLDSRLPGRSASTVTVQRDLTESAGVTYVSAPEVTLVNDTLRIVGRTATNHLVVIITDVSWRSRASSVIDVTSAARDAGITSSPVWMPSGTGILASSPTGSLLYYQLPDACFATPATCSSIATTNLTIATGAPLLTSALSVTATATGVAVVGLTAAGSAVVISGTSTGASYSWVDTNLTSASGAPAFTGRPFIAVAGSVVTVAGTAANWNDLFAISNDGVGGAWVDVDVSATGGSAARTVGGGITGALVDGSLVLFAGGVNSPAPTGTGVYAIPETKNTAAIVDKWPSIGITGALGTSGSPWVATKTSLTQIRYSQDFLVGKAIAESHVRTTWLSFWTVSGPARGEPVDVPSYYKHGYVAGKAVATQIGTYRSLGLGLKPDWVIIDPEGYPDYHSCLDGTNTLAPWCPPWNPKLWAAYANGWAAGLEEIDDSLHAGIYASQNEYKNGGLAALSMPVFVAVAFKWFSTSASSAIPLGATSVQVASSAGLYANQKFYIRDAAGPEFLQIAPSYNGTSLTVPLTSATKRAHVKGVVVNGITPPLRLSTTVGNNIIGFTAFGSSNACLAVPWQIALFNQAPWSGLYNTLQFDGGVYCRPSGT